MSYTDKAQRACDEWNRVYSVGTRITLQREDGTETGVSTTTSSEAVLGPDGRPAVHLTGYQTLFLLALCQPVAP